MLPMAGVASCHQFSYLTGDLQLQGHLRWPAARPSVSSDSRFRHPHTLRCSQKPELGQQDVGCSEERLLLVERYKDGTSRRYITNNKSQLQIMWNRDTSPNTRSDREEEEKDQFLMLIKFLPNSFKDFILPAGFPESVSDDYLDYMLLQFPTNVTGWLCHTLVTSSLLKAVGVGSFSGTTAAASAAAIRWVSKDGLGAFGRLLIGGRFGKLFDDDPKQWRMYADFIGSAASIFELSTQPLPDYFLLLASLGNFIKATARGLKDPSFRVIQNHFSVSDNLGEIASKEEVWEVVAQLFGLSLGILVLDTPGIQSSYNTIAITWLCMRMLHLWLRYQSLAVLKFQTMNLKRARILVKSHVLHKSVFDYVRCNKEENILCWERFSQPRIVFGTSLDTTISSVDTSISSNTVESLLKLYVKERYILTFNQTKSKQLSFLVSFKVEASSMSVLRSLWQAHWLSENWTAEVKNVFDFLKLSVQILQVEFDDFLVKLEQSGWNVDSIILKVPRDVLVEVADNLT